MLNLNVSQGLTAESILSGVDAAPVAALPTVWQKIANGELQVGHPDREFLVALARLFYTKATDGSPEIFSRFPLSELYSVLVWETLEFYGNDFLVSAYPDFALALETASAPESEKVVSFAQAVFDDFGYALPASFYRMLLCPVERESIYESRALFFHSESQGVKRPYDACLHAMNVTAMLLRVQHHASRYGFLLQHACGCAHMLAQIISGDDYSVVFDFESPQGRQKALTAYTWRMWNEYFLFQFGIHSQTLAL